MKEDTKIALGALAVGIAAFVWARKNTKGTSGIGAAKRRIYKEISLSVVDEGGRRPVEHLLPPIL